MPHPSIDSQITFMTVADLEASADFYGRVLGLHLVLDQHTCRIYRTTPSAYLGICTHREDVRAEGVIVTLVTDQVDRWFERLTRLGVEIEAAPRLNERFNIYHLFLRDPDGHLVEIQEFKDRGWADR
jgi:catechol 2,3-dioxygenase-like lactoylglutathione lyase family enzyme